MLFYIILNILLLSLSSSSVIDSAIQAVIFCDNAGADVVLGILPFARELLRKGTKVDSCSQLCALTTDVVQRVNAYEAMLSYTCMHVRMYVCTYDCVDVYMYVCLHIGMHTCMYACMYVCTYVFVDVYVYVCTYVCVFAYMYTCLHVCMYACMYA